MTLNYKKKGLMLCLSRDYDDDYALRTWPVLCLLGTTYEEKMPLLSWEYSIRPYHRMRLRRWRWIKVI